MKQIEQIVLLGFLYVLARIVYKTKAHPLILLGGFGAAGLVFSRSAGVLSPLNMIGGVCVGVFLLLCALAMKEGIGVGDGLLFCATGIYLGLWQNLFLLFLSVLFCATAGGMLVIKKKCTRKASLAFAPFVLAADVAMLALMSDF